MANANTSSTGVITEQGDLGLGFNPISKEEERVLKESANKSAEKEGGN